MSGTDTTTRRRRLFVINCMIILPRGAGEGRGLPRHAPPATCVLLNVFYGTSRRAGRRGGVEAAVRVGGRRRRRGEEGGRIYVQVPTLFLFTGLENET
jgi:hypothetical protein